jgi:hypothetical protein
MKKPFLLFALKAAVILYFAACTSIDHYTTGKSATPIVTKGVWKVNFFKDAYNGRTSDLAGYTFTFNSSGVVKASKNGVDISGNWFEDDIANRISIDLGATDPSLIKMNGDWNIRNLNNATVEFGNDNDAASEKLNITML